MPKQKEMFRDGEIKAEISQLKSDLKEVRELLGENSNTMIEYGKFFVLSGKYLNELLQSPVHQWQDLMTRNVVFLLEKNKDQLNCLLSSLEIIKKVIIIEEEIVKKQAQLKEVLATMPKRKRAKEEEELEDDKPFPLDDPDDNI